MAVMSATRQLIARFLAGGQFRQEKIGEQAYQRIACETFSGILHALPWHLVFIPVFVLLYCVVLAQWIEIGRLVKWYVLVVLSSTIPISYLYFLYHRDGASFNYARAEWLLVLAGGITSVFVGLSSWLFFDAIPGHTVLLLIVLLALGPAVIAVAFAGSMLLWLSITIGLMGPLLSFMFLKWDSTDIISGKMFGSWLLMYLVYTFYIAYKQNVFVKENLYLKYQLEKSLKTRSQYIEIASHDLRQPMHAMGLFIDALSPHVADDGRLAYDKLSGSVKALRGLFDSLLDMSRLDAKLIQPDYQAIPLLPHLQKLRNEFSEQAQDKGLSLRLDCPQVTVSSDVFLLERTVRNLLSNAIKFSERGEILVSCDCKASCVSISVCDQGPGMAAAELDKIFSEYHQINRPDETRTRGLGLGLAIVRRICDLMDIPLKVESTPGEGSCFFIEIPLASEDNVPEQRKQQPAWDLKNMSVIVIDDEEDVLSGMGQVLSLWKCQTLLASSIEDALAQISQDTGPPAIIIADYRLGNGVTGIDAIARIREEFNREIPGLLITGDTIAKRLEEAAEYDLMLMHKPISPASLRSAIYQTIKHGS